MKYVVTLMALLLSPLAAHAGDLDFGYTMAPEPGEQPALYVTPSRAVANLWITIETGNGTYEHKASALAAGTAHTVSWPADGGTNIEATVTCDFTDGHREELILPLTLTYGSALEIDLSAARADVAQRTLTVSVTAPVDRAEIVVYGARKAKVAEKQIGLTGGPGEVEIPWVGDPSDAVLLDVKVWAGDSWASFSYSPWFLDIPHEDVLFESGRAEIRATEEPKLRDTLTQLRDVLDKYGSVVPVKLYIAGCTDTVGSASANKSLSERRARAIASWLRSNGYSQPIYYYGFGESLLADPTGDEVESAANRRALYMVGANPPPAGSGVPSVNWWKL